MNLSFTPLNKSLSAPHQVLRKTTSSILLSSDISIPRVSLYQCDQCGHRVTRMCSYDEPYQSAAQGRHRLDRPTSLYADSENYVKFHHQQAPLYANQQKRKSKYEKKPRSQENVYEDIPAKNYMSTLDFRIKVTADVLKDNDGFSDSFNETSDDYENKSSLESPDKLKQKDIFIWKAKRFKKKCLRKMSSL